MHVRDDELELYIFGRLSHTQDLVVESHLIECEACAAKLSDAVTFAGRLAELSRRQRPEDKERRRHPRVSADDPASVKLLNPPWSGPLEARVLDISREGLKLRVAEFLNPGSLVQIRLKGTVAFGEIRHCRPVDTFFDVGVWLRDVFPNVPD